MNKLSNSDFRRLFPQDSLVGAEIQKAFGLIKAARSILISSTLTSDGDSIGAQLGMAALIQALRPQDRPKLQIVNESPVPVRYSFLKSTDLIVSFSAWKDSSSSKSFDLGIVCDGGVERTGKLAPFFDSIPNTILVDHHVVGSEREYNAKILDTSASSTCEIVYFLFQEAKIEISPEVAEALYIGIVFDTGFFKHSITTPKTHFVAADLISTGIDFSEISDRAILERSQNGQILLRKLMENMEIHSEGKIVTSFWSQSDLQEADAEDGDSEGMINQLYHTRGAEVVVLFVETGPQELKVSFRSKGKVNVADFARSLNPRGGGHVRASGCSLTGSIQDAKAKVVSALEKALVEL
ncbi:MAG: bifunctional oligoribonuclease/PAP phosphatase NrnA [Bradymonadales bacterium]|nr:MAG: bifunctional oligoribonuclease/PAP phosphatase NrnA [Bradymonadales bacterium]